MGKASKLVIIVLMAVCVYQFYYIEYELQPQITLQQKTLSQDAGRIEALSNQVLDLQSQVDNLNNSLNFIKNQEMATSTRNFAN